jgi:hypothetical protein
MPARGVPQDGYVGQVEPSAGSFLHHTSEGVDRQSDVLTSCRPAAAVPDAPELDIPRSNSVKAQVEGKRRTEAKGEAASPSTTVNDHHHRDTGVPRREEKLAPLVWVRAVLNPYAGRGDVNWRQADGLSHGSNVVENTGVELFLHHRRRYSLSLKFG